MPWSQSPIVETGGVTAERLKHNVCQGNGADGDARAPRRAVNALKRAPFHGNIVSRLTRFRVRTAIRSPRWENVEPEA